MINKRDIKSGVRGQGSGVSKDRDRAGVPEPRTPNPEPRVLWAIVGPTCVGKTAVGLAVARRIGAEIVSADSRQVYRYMDIGTAKPSLDEQRTVRHHLIDIVDPDEPFSAGEYGRRARQVIAELCTAGVTPLIVGGAGLYIRALMGGLFHGPSVPEAVRQRLKERLGGLGPEALHRELRTVDPEAAARLHPHDRQRIVRALEVYEATGMPLTTWQRTTSKTAPSLCIRMIGLQRDRAELYRMIEARAHRMIDAGLIDEVRRLLDMGYTPDSNALRTFGYVEVIACLRGEVSLDRTIALIQQRTRQYAKRQMTWFRHAEGVQWVELSEKRDRDVVCEEVLKSLKSEERSPYG